MNQFKTIEYSIKNRTACIIMNRPKSLNAFNSTLKSELSQAIEQADSDSIVRNIIISGRGRCFSSGADLKDVLSHYNTIEEELLKEYKPFLMAIRNSDKLYISAINGACAGIATGLAMACDLCVMADNAYLYQAFAAIGLIPDGGVSWHLLNTLGYKRAMEAIICSKKLSAEQCLYLGIANKVVPANTLLTETQSWAEQIAKGSPLAQKYSKKLLRHIIMADLPEAFDIEAKFQNKTTDSYDFKNAVAAFFEKHPITFADY
ncbi:enoyl-CoA hydratase/isomerase family protein [Microbulbifer spongiae]|uniref:Enoyl-CoA hydratase/isomerase family protein n=1 Tax=Microbulbifer spongiae TaxID=2944933 RepID=A0ABY9E7R1_9GAMM|nr:enoyl-CoA hydratase/isomerase family protein [Microbulbifer sp. MI-G]WKD49043.1 enoyl-CoA hydratase/isomerase family protein [Microbulbifer sp. MI-G]